MADFPLAGTHGHLASNIKDINEFLITFVGDGLAATVESVPVLESLAGLTDGVTTSFDLLNYFKEGSTRVFAAGVLMNFTVDWVENDDRGGITLAVAPDADARLEVEYLAEVDL